MKFTWIKWKYNDHEHGDWKEIELPDWLIEEYDKTPAAPEYVRFNLIRNWLIEDSPVSNYIPSWSERYLPERVKWEKLEKPSRQTLLIKIKNHKNIAAHSRKEAKRLESILMQIGG